MSFVNLNGKLLDDTVPYFKANRAFKYGDGVFESIRIVSGNMMSFDAHYRRLMSALKAIRVKIPNSYTKEYFLENIIKLLKANNIVFGASIRLSVFRDAQGRYFPNEDNISFFIESFNLNDNNYKLNSEGILINVYKDIKKNINILSPYKTLNSLINVLAVINAKEKSFDDSLLINENENIIEASSSNVFIVSNGVLYTPSLNDGCVGGIMRMKIINLALKNNITIYECSLNMQNLMSADEIFLTNAISGIIWVGGFNNKRYYNSLSKRIMNILIEDTLKPSLI